MLFVHDVAVRPDFSVRTLDCHHDARSWSPLKRVDSHELVLLRRGRFRRRADGVVSDVDTTMAFMSTPGIEEQFAHTTSDGDACTVVIVDADLWHAHPRLTPVYVDARLDLLHRQMLAAADIDFSLAEQLVKLLTAVFGQSYVGSPADTAAVAAAREAIAAKHPAAKGLFTLAKTLEISPYRLSRAFSRELGVTLSRYRNRVRVTQVLDRIEQGETNLGGLAAEAGFADQAHLSRTVREHLGITPTALRKMLAASR